MGMKPYVSSLTRAETPAPQISSSDPMLLLAVPLLRLLIMCYYASSFVTELVEAVFDQFEKEVLPLLDSIPSGVIHVSTLRTPNR